MARQHLLLLSPSAIYVSLIFREWVVSFYSILSQQRDGHPEQDPNRGLLICTSAIMWRKQMTGGLSRGNLSRVSD